MFVKTEIWKKYGGFITEYIAYSEDSEWCLRLNKGKEVLVYIPDAIIWHKDGGSINLNTKNEQHTISPYARYLMTRNHLWTIRIYFKRIIAFILIVINILVVFRLVIIWLIKMNNSHVKSILKGLKEGIFKSYPKPHNFDFL